MNFLLHRHLALQELESDVAGIGAMLPDVWRMAERRMRARHGVDHGGELQRGIAHHLEADVWFHRLAIFREGERRLAAELAAVPAPKLGLFGHVAWEMCLDGALLLACDLERMLASLRDELRRASPGLASAARAHGAARLADPELFDRRVGELFGAIAAGPWIDGYRSGEGLVDRVSGLRRRFGFAPLAGAERAVAAHVLGGALARARLALPQLLAERAEVRAA
jgi:hypothetical protein